MLVLAAEEVEIMTLGALAMLVLAAVEVEIMRRGVPMILVLAAVEVGILVTAAVEEKILGAPSHRVSGKPMEAGIVKRPLMPAGPLLSHRNSPLPIHIATPEEEEEDQDFIVPPNSQRNHRVTQEEEEEHQDFITPPSSLRNHRATADKEEEDLDSPRNHHNTADKEEEDQKILLPLTRLLAPPSHHTSGATKSLGIDQKILWAAHQSRS